MKNSFLDKPDNLGSENTHQMPDLETIMTMTLNADIYLMPKYVVCIYQLYGHRMLNF